MQAIAQHAVVIVCGETGSGKTTQLPKICMALGRGQHGLIGHTQPRRIAAVSVAKRLAQEVNSTVGEAIGYQIRFQDKVSPQTCVKLMTDGILLAETQKDPLLRQYDTIIIDEAHERSLNIDFLLGLLKHVLKKRPDLKVIITSATIDAERFAQHFADHQGRPAPVIEVSGRLYPVEIRYRPLWTPDVAPKASAKETTSEHLALSKSGDEEKDRIDGIVDAVMECERVGSGDVLVFLPGEREIREAAEALRKAPLKHAQILPLFARMSQAEQERIFHPSTQQRRIILATNVAETSLTVPGIRFVVDTGLARVKRYSWRNKVEQLQIEKISQAAANQRAGRCGRVGAGVCIRLYDEADFLQRPAFTDPEILRSSLASVILRMKALRLHHIERFPFVDPPTGKAIADGYHLLQELGALDNQNRLTPVGRLLAELPLDPKIARMILAGRQYHSLNEVLIIAAALSVQDPRDRPFDAKTQSEQAHAKFRDDKSEFLSYLKLWDWYHDKVKHKVSQRKLVAELREQYLSPVRLREWHDIHTQLRTLVAEKGWRLLNTPATYEQIHKALLTGLLGHLLMKSDSDTGLYQGARDIRVALHPGSSLAKKAGKWILAGELVDTSRLFARTLAQVDPLWVEQVAPQLLKKQYSDPQWQRKRGQVSINERATLYGLPIYHGRKVLYGRLDPKAAREVFIREALLTGDIDTSVPFVQRNRRLVQDIEKLEHKSRRLDILVDDELIVAFYDRLLPEDMHQTATLEAWYKGLSAQQRQALLLNKADLMRHEAAGITTQAFPKSVHWDGHEFALSYHFEPGSPKDGVTLSVPVYALGQINEHTCQWLVPGMLREKVQALLKSLPQKLRRHCVPLPDYARDFYLRHETLLAQPTLPLIQALIDDLWLQKQVRVKPEDFKQETLPAHLSMIFKVVDEHGRMLSAGRHLAPLKAEHAQATQASFQQLAHVALSDLGQARIVDWSFGELPEILEIQRNGQSLIGYPALIDKGEHCELDVFDDLDIAQRHHRQGLLRLFKRAFAEPLKYWRKNIHNLTTLSMLYLPLGTQEMLLEELIDCALGQTVLQTPWPHNADTFAHRQAQAREKLGLVLNEVARLAGQILEQWQQTQKKMGAIKAHKAAYQDMIANQAALVHARFLTAHPYTQLQHFPRYLKADFMRADKLQSDPVRDATLLAEIQPLYQQYQRRLQQLKGQPDARMDEFRWLLQELRVALFAQTLRTPMPVSVKRLQKAWLQLQA